MASNELIDKIILKQMNELSLVTTLLETNEFERKKEN